ncbi:hypothetical protein [Actinopolymorpha pittospori]|uniref:Uncharacterized protein n=1 Tax=Actinopolymorpha pittospori TaxID=648752 RepID=A0A927RD02_9ACTN|nr:hypothetical protein [Actinopolymorpha pittospori]MBE1610459.1 hypothetical protein [Actinopolymorpha pittospori]
MSWLRKVFGGKDDLAPSAPLDLDVEQRKEQLLRLEGVLDRLVEVMKDNQTRMANPAWKERMAEYRRLSGESYRLRAGGFTREQLLDLAFEIRPVFGGELPEDVRVVEPLQTQLLEAAAEIQGVLPGERPGG